MSLDHEISPRKSPVVPKVILHVGRHKTGTSAIQSLLAVNDELLAGEYGILYPRTGRDPRKNYHHPLFSPLVDDMLPLDQAQIQTIMQEAHERNCHTVLLSSEILGRKGLTDDQLRGVRDAFVNHEINVILYFRRQDFFLESTYANRIRMGLLKAPTKIQDLDASLDYFQFANRYAAIFGKFSLIVRSYDEATATGLFESFLSILGISSSDVFSRPTSRVNQRLPWRYLELIRHANRWHWARRLALLSIVSRTAIELSRIFPGFMDRPRPLSQEQRRQIVMFHQASSDQLAREFLNREHLF